MHSKKLKHTVPIETEYHDTRITPISFRTYSEYARESIKIGGKNCSELRLLSPQKDFGKVSSILLSKIKHYTDASSIC